NGIAKTVIGYLASSLGVRIDVENPGSRFLMTVAFCLLHRIVYMIIDRGLVAGTEPWYWGYTLLSAVANGLLAVVLFAALDRLKKREQSALSIRPFVVTTRLKLGSNIPVKPVLSEFESRSAG